MTAAIPLNLRESVRALLIAAGKDGMTQIEVEAALAARDETRGRFKGYAVSGTLSNLCRIGVVRRIGKRAGARRAVLVYAATGLPLPLNAGGAGRQTAHHRRPPLPETDWPRHVRQAVEILRRRGWGVWPLAEDLWEAGGHRTTEELLDLADRFAPELAAAEARP